MNAPILIDISNLSRRMFELHELWFLFFSMPSMEEFNQVNRLHFVECLPWDQEAEGDEGAACKEVLKRFAIAPPPSAAANRDTQT